MGVGVGVGVCVQLGEELGEGEFGPVVVGMAHDIISHEAVTQVCLTMTMAQCWL